MWKKSLLIFLLFYIFAILQSSFLPHFNFFGVVPNIIFVLFFLLTFFSKKEPFYYVIFLSIVAGLFSDIFYNTYLGPSVIIFIIIGFLTKKTQSMLKNQETSYPFIYFLPLFCISLVFYNLLFSLYVYILNQETQTIIWASVFYSLVYNTALASLLFYIYKKFIKQS